MAEHRESIEILSLLQWKEEETIWCQIQIIMRPSVPQKNLLVIEMKKTNKLKNKPVYLELSILELNNVLMNILWYDYVRANYDEKASVLFGCRFGYLDTDLVSLCS